MCGIAGVLSNQTVEFGILKKMSDTIQHRGPNGAGVWIDYRKEVGFSHRRLSIVDLSPAGHQPMLSHDERYCIVFNGEIYNHLKLRADLDSQGRMFHWRGHSDTETLLASFESWGIETTLTRCIGMFSIALWDNQEQSLTLIRDRIGEKPLYYGWQGDCFLFGSELKALSVHPSFNKKIDRNALCLYLRHSYIPSPHSIYQGVSKLLPGTLLTVSLQNSEPQIKTWWSAPDIAIKGVSKPFSGTANDAVNALDILLTDAVGQQMIADVPLGAFLSGGIDSSLIVALMQKQSNNPVQTFSIGFHDELYNEAEHAKIIAQHLGTNHTELYVTPEDALSVIPHLPMLYDEPFADSSQIPTFLVSQLARQQVTVSLTGDAGDELFAGYNRYNMTKNIWGKLAHIPRPLRQLASLGVTSISPGSWNSMSAVLYKMLPTLNSLTNIGDKLHKGAGVLSCESIDKLYLGLTSLWKDPASVVIGGSESATFLKGNSPNLKNLNDLERMMLLDLLSYLPDDILCKVDRAAMGVSLESRVPFLDHRVVEFAWQLPMEYKLRDGKTKWVLREVLYKHVPKKLIERPKMGFGVPIGHWLRGPLRDWAEGLLDESRLQQEGFFNPIPIRQQWKEHLSESRNWEHQLWGILMFQAWLEKNHSMELIH